MRKNTVYSIMALSVVPGAISAAVGVNSGTAIVSAENKVEVDFGTLVPGKYKLSATVATGAVTQATLAGQAATVSTDGKEISAEITLTAETAVTFVAEGAAEFTLGTYQLDLDWDDVAAYTTLNTLLNKVKNEAEAWDVLADFQDQINEQATGIAAVFAGTDAEKYNAYKTYRFYNEKDDITTALEQIEKDAHVKYIDNSYAAATAGVEPIEATIGEVQTIISGLTIAKKDARQEALDLIKADLETFKNEAEAATGVKDGVEAAWDFTPTKSFADIQAALDALKTLVESDKAKIDRYTELTTRQSTALTSLQALQTKIAAQKQESKKTANTTEYESIEEALAAYLTAAGEAYDEAVAVDGGSYDYDAAFTNLTALEARVAALADQITADEEAYAAAQKDLLDAITAGNTLYEEKLAEVTAAITEEAYADVLEKAQADLLAQKLLLDAQKTAVEEAAAAGEDIDTAAAQTAITAITDEITNIAATAIANAENYRTLYAAFNTQINSLVEQLEAKKAEAQAAAGVGEALTDTFNQLDEEIQQLQANLVSANVTADADGNHRIGDVGYTPVTYDGKTIADIEAEIAALSISQATVELAAKTASLEAINAKTPLLEAAIAEVAEYNKSANYDAAARWQVVTSAIQEQIDAAVAAVNEAFADGQGTGAQGYKNNTLEATVAAIQTAIDDYVADAKAAIDANKTLEDKIAASTTALATLKAAVEDKAIYNDTTYEFDDTTNYSAKIAAIQEQIDAVQADLDAANEKNGTENKDALEAIDYTAYKVAAVADKTIDEAIEYLTANADSDQAAYEEAFAQTLRDSMSDLVQTRQTALLDDVNKSKDTNYTAQVEALGMAADDILAAYDALIADVQAVETERAAQDSETAVNAVAKFNELVTKLETLRKKLGEIEQQVTAAKAAKVADAAAQADLAAKLEALKTALEAAKTHVTEECTDVTVDFSELDAAVAALETAISDAATAQNTVEKKTDLDNEVTRISNLINTTVDKADKAQAKYTANVELNTLYNEVNTYMGEQRALVGAIAGTTPDELDQEAIAFFKNKFNGEGGFVERLAAIKKAIQDDYADEDLAASEYASDLKQKLDALKTEIGAVLPAAQANYTSYKAQLEEYNRVKVVYDENYAKISDASVYDQDLEVTKESKEAMEAYAWDTESGELAQLLATIQNSYTGGTAGSVESEDMAALQAVESAILNIISTMDDDDYGIAVRAQNDATYADQVMVEIQKIQTAYQEAVAVLKDYQNVSDAGLRNAINSVAETLNNAVFEAPQKKTDFTTRANTEKSEANTAKEIWDASALIADIQAYVEDLDNAKETFLNTIVDAINIYWMLDVKNPHNSRINQLYNNLNGYGYLLNGETKEDVFKTELGWIAQGDEIMANLPINVTALDALFTLDGFSADTYIAHDRQVANDFAKSVVDTKLDEYTNAETGKTVTDWAEIEAIIADGYDLPEGETPIDEQFNNIVANNLASVVDLLDPYYNRGSLYMWWYSMFEGYFNDYDSQVADLKVKAAEWAQAKKDREEAAAALAEAKAEALKAIETLEALLNQSLVAGNYDSYIDMFKDIVEEATDEAGVSLVTDSYIPIVEGWAVNNLKATLLPKISELKAAFNQYATSEGADEAKVADFSARITAAQAALEKSDATLAEVVAAQNDIAKLLTELGEANGTLDSTAIAAELTERAEALENATLGDETADYGDQTEDINNALQSIKDQAKAIADEVAQHEADGDIALYNGTLADKLTNLENELQWLQGYAAGVAEQVAEEKAQQEAKAAKSNEVFEALSEIIVEVEALYNDGKTAIEGYTNSHKDTDLSSLEAYQVEDLKNEITEANENAELDDDSLESYTEQLENLKNNIANALKYAAAWEADKLYFNTNGDSELYAAKSAAWDTWGEWSFAAKVKASFQTKLNGYDEEIAAFQDQMRNDYIEGTLFDQMATYAETAAAIIAEYNALVEEIEDFKPFGDSNSDGYVNVLDYRAVSNMILDPTLQPDDDTAAFLVTDVNQNEIIEVGDLTGIVNIIMGREWNETAPALMPGSSESLAMTTASTQTGTQRIAISLNNVREYTAFQMDIVLPDGVTLVGKQLSDRASDNHTLLSRVQQDGSIRLLASSFKGETFSGNEGAVLYLDVETTAGSSLSDVQVLNAIFSDVYANSHVLTIADTTTGISTLDAAGRYAKAKVYDLGGRLMNGLKKGYNIIRHADGTVEKRVVK